MAFSSFVLRSFAWSCCVLRGLRVPCRRVDYSCGRTGCRPDPVVYRTAFDREVNPPRPYFKLPPCDRHDPVVRRCILKYLDGGKVVHVTVVSAAPRASVDDCRLTVTRNKEVVVLYSYSTVLLHAPAGEAVGWYPSLSRQALCPPSKGERGTAPDCQAGAASRAGEGARPAAGREGVLRPIPVSAATNVCASHPSSRCRSSSRKASYSLQEGRMVLFCQRQDSMGASHYFARIWPCLSER